MSGDITETVRPGFAKYKKRKERLYGCLPGRDI
jgi:hypothetical protein